MIRPFHNTTLTDIFLSKLAGLAQNTFFAGYEDVFESMIHLSTINPTIISCRLMHARLFFDLNQLLIF